MRRYRWAQITGQGVLEYFIILTVVLAAIIAIGIISPRGGRIRNIFQDYFDRAAAEMR